MDVSDALQGAINKGKTEKSFGILFIPEGKCRINKTIYVAGSVRLIVYGVTRPEIIPGKITSGFQKLDSGSRYVEKYYLLRMLFTMKLPVVLSSSVFLLNCLSNR